jgi:hypothetical protein
MIVWLASYPKSGNTWVRLFLSNLLSSEKDFSINNNNISQFPLRSHFKNITDNVNDQGEFAKHCVRAQEIINQDNKLKFLKTHNAFWNWGGGDYTFTDKKNTLGVIYIARDPRNVITSVLNYYHKESYNHALEFMIENKVLGGDNSEIGLPTIVGSWSNHYKSWKKFNKNYLIIKYENLLKDPLNEFFKITNYLENISNIKFEKNEITKTIKNCSFENMSKQENKIGFNDNTKTNKLLKQKFFNLGPNNRWVDYLDKEILNKIEENFGNEMKELGYL